MQVKTDDMTHYLDIHLLHDPEIPPHALMAALFNKIHRVLAEMGSNTIGIAFPGYQKTPPQIGDHLRLVGPSDALHSLLDRPWLSTLRDHTRVSKIMPIPINVEHRYLRRVQAKSSPERLRRRQMMRHGLSETDAHKKIPDGAAKHLSLPFIQIKSSSTRQTFRLFFDLSEPQPLAYQGTFNAYGLSSNQTIPWF